MQADIIPITVTYSNGQFSYDPPQPIVASLPPGNCVLVFTLKGDTDIAWAPDFIQWTGAQPPILAELPRVANGNFAVLGINNDVTSECQYDFRLKITSTVTSPDPDIVLDPP